jgi:pimeloyl-ACP methyl ester carboxylesterase
MAGVLMRVVGVLPLLTAFAVPLMRATDREVATLVARWAPPPSDFLDLQGQLIHVRDEGPRRDPVPIALLHATSSSSHAWDGSARALRGQRRVIRLDLPGFGLTGPYTGASAGRTYTPAENARFTRAVLDAMKVQRFVIGGKSLGGDVA